MSSEKKPSGKSDLHIFLDLDNTLIHSIECEHKDRHNKIKNLFKQHTMEEDFIIYERPGLQEFLDWLFKKYKVSVWSAGSESYVDYIVDNIVENSDRKVEYVLHSKHCDESQSKYGSRKIKDLRMLWDIYDLPELGPYNTILIDDLKTNMTTNRENSLLVKKFIASDKGVDDKVLKNLCHFLENIEAHYNHDINSQDEFRLIDKNDKIR